jgi:hypothetical protein
VLEQIKNEDLRVYAVYLPILQNDQESSIPSALKSLPDNRVRFYWDGKGSLSKDYAPVLQLPEGQPAWDIYLAFARQAEWKDAPPAPDFWMHQLRSQSLARRLDGTKFAEETKRLLQAGKKEWGRAKEEE